MDLQLTLLGLVILTLVVGLGAGYVRDRRRGRSGRADDREDSSFETDASRHGQGDVDGGSGGGD